MSTTHFADQPMCKRRPTVVVDAAFGRRAAAAVTAKRHNILFLFACQESGERAPEEPRRRPPFYGSPLLHAPAQSCFSNVSCATQLNARAATVLSRHGAVMPQAHTEQHQPVKSPPSIQIKRLCMHLPFGGFPRTEGSRWWAREGTGKPGNWNGSLAASNLLCAFGGCKVTGKVQWARTREERQAG